MKKLIAIYLAALLAITTVGFTHEYQVMTLPELTQETLESITKMESPHIIVQLTEGDIWPLELSLTGEFLEVEENSTFARIKVLKTCYLKAEADNLWFSTDLLTWKTYMEQFTGSIGGFVNITEGEPKLGIYADIKQRKE